MTKRRLGFLVLILLLAAVIFNFELIRYGLRQASGQWHIVSNARPVEEYLNDETVADSVKYKLNIIDEVRNYAVDNLLLTDTENYTEMYDQQGEPLLWVVTGCEPYEFRPYEWTFPVLGSVPYKGFFKLAYANHTAKELQDKGLDVNIRTVGGWSTLGWFKDPILSEMLNREDGDLANLIIHELVHSTIFVKDSVEFNENLASFIADKGTLKYLTEIYGEQSQQLLTYVNNKRDQKNFIDHMLRGYDTLDSLYTNVKVDTIQMRKMKLETISSIMESLDTISLNNPNYFSKIKDYVPNNAYFMSFRRYQSKQGVLDSLYNHEYGGDLLQFITHLKNKHAAS